MPASSCSWSATATTKVERITLAGAFGSHIDTAYAMALGLIPDCPSTRSSSAGNAAGTGARIALLNARPAREIGEVVRHIEKVETAIEPGFQAHFVGRWRSRMQAMRSRISRRGSASL